MNDDPNPLLLGSTGRNIPIFEQTCHEYRYLIDSFWLKSLWGKDPKEKFLKILRGKEVTDGRRPNQEMHPTA